MIYRVATSQVDVTVPQGQSASSIVNVKATPSGQILRVASKQISGNNTAYTLYIFNSENIDSNFLKLNTIAGPFSVSSGGDLLEFSQNRWYYNNLDSSAPNAGFYVQVRTSGNVSNECKFRIAITWMTNES